MPQTPKNSRTAIETQLERILTSGGFSQSDRMRGLLAYLVRSSLDGKADSLKEVVIALEVFGRDDYDPKTESLIRVTIAKLRTKLNEYYAGPGATDSIRISIAKGSFVPVIEEPAAPAKIARWKPRLRWVAMAAVALAAVLLAWWRFTIPIPVGESSIAVLPFLDLTSDRRLGYFCDGLTEELTDALTKHARVAVVARTSTFEFKDKPYDIRTIGTKLAADYLIEGSVRESGGQLRITVQLIRTATGLHVFSQVYELQMAELFSTQDRIVDAVLRAVGQPSSGRQTKRQDLDLYRDYLKSRALRGIHTTAGDKQSLEILESIIARDPEFAAAQADLAWQIFNLGLDGPLGPVETVTRVKHHAAAALRADPSNGLAHAMLCRILAASDWEWSAAEKECREGVNLSPGAADRYTDLGVILAMIGRPEGVTALKRAVELDPLSPRAIRLLAQGLYFTRNYEEGIRVGNTALVTHPEDPYHSIYLALSHLALKDYPAAIAAATRGNARNQQRENIGWLGLVASIYAASGDRVRALNLLDQIEAAEGKQHVSPMIKARIHACLGDAEQTFKHLELGYDEHDLLMPWLAVDARFDPYRNDPRFKNLMRRMRL